MALDILEFVSAYESGLFTRVETLFKMTQLAAEVPVVEIAAELSPWWLNEMRVVCAVRSQYPSGELICLSSICAGPSYESDRVQSEDIERLHRGIAAWQAYFALTP